MGVVPAHMPAPATHVQNYHPLARNFNLVCTLVPWIWNCKLYFINSATLPFFPSSHLPTVSEVSLLPPDDKLCKQGLGHIDLHVNSIQSPFQILYVPSLDGFFVCFLFFCLFAISWATPEAYGGYQARGLIRAVATSLHHSHRIQPATSWFPVRFISTAPRRGLHPWLFLPYSWNLPFLQENRLFLVQSSIQHT